MRQAFNDEHGATLVEFAFASVILFTVMFGIFDFGIAVARYNMLAALSQEGARFASVRGSKSQLLDKTAADVSHFVQGRAGFPVTVTTTRFDPGEHHCSRAATDPSAIAPGDPICVTVESGYTRVAALIPIPSMLLRSRSMMIVSR